MVKVGIIILHYGKKENTLHCLSSIKKLKSPAEKFVLVVDNGTHSLNEDELKKIYPSIMLLKNNKNLGFSEGNNKAIAFAAKNGCNYLLLIGNDIEVSPNLLSHLLNAFKKDPHLGIAGTVITYADRPEVVWFGGGYLNKTFCYTQHLFMNMPTDTLKRGTVSDFINGSVMMIKREVFSKAGLFDPAYFLYWEDVDLSVRAKQAGYKLAVINKPLAKHHVSSAAGVEGTNKLNEVRAYYFARNPFIFMRRHGLFNFTAIVGQLCIRLPYYMLSLTGLTAFFAYARGLKDGMMRKTINPIPVLPD